MISYQDQLQRYEWKERRAQILKRDNNQCTKCDNTEDLNVHHKYYLNNVYAWDYPDSALVTLCRDCHKKEHGIQPSSVEIIKTAKEGIIGLMCRVNG